MKEIIMKVAKQTTKDIGMTWIMSIPMLVIYFAVINFRNHDLID